MVADPRQPQKFNPVKVKVCTVSVYVEGCNMNENGKKYCIGQKAEIVTFTHSVQIITRPYCLLFVLPSFGNR